MQLVVVVGVAQVAERVEVVGVMAVVVAEAEAEAVAMLTVVGVRMGGVRRLVHELVHQVVLLEPVHQRVGVAVDWERVLEQLVAVLALLLLLLVLVLKLQLLDQMELLLVRVVVRRRDERV